jgi:hypothetical protein
MDGVWIPLVLGTGFFAMIASMSYLGSKSKSDRARFQAEVQARLIDKFGSGPEFVTFLQSPSGREFMGNIESAPRVYSRERILSGVRKSIVVSFLGAAFIILAFTPSGAREMIVPGILLLFLGLGFLVSAAMSAKLSKQWGLFDEHPAAALNRSEYQPPVQS